MRYSMSKEKKHEGLAIARLLMVFSSISPLFILWAIKGANTPRISESLFLIICISMVIIPNLFLLIRIYIVKKRKDKKTKTIGIAEDHRDHLLIYLFTMLLPFYSANINSLRDLITHLAAIGFIVFLFWHSNMHYMNIFWAIKGYRIFTITPNDSDNPNSGMRPYVLITYRNHLKPNEKINAYRISQTVFWEKKK